MQQNSSMVPQEAPVAGTSSVRWSRIALLVLAPVGDSLLRPPYGLIEVVPIALLGFFLLVTGRLQPTPAPTK